MIVLVYGTAFESGHELVYHAFQHEKEVRRRNRRDSIRIRQKRRTRMKGHCIQTTRAPRDRHDDSLSFWITLGTGLGVSNCAFRAAEAEPQALFIQSGHRNQVVSSTGNITCLFNHQLDSIFLDYHSSDMVADHDSSIGRLKFESQLEPGLGAPLSREESRGTQAKLPSRAPAPR